MKDNIRNINEVIYRGEIIQRIGKGFLYEGILWPQIDGLKNAIDNQMDGTKKPVIITTSKENPSIKLKWNGPHK